MKVANLSFYNDNYYVKSIPTNPYLQRIKIMLLTRPFLFHLFFIPFLPSADEQQRFTHSL